MMGSKSDQFVLDLVQFYRNRGNHNPQPQHFIARLNGKIVNLNELYSHVLENGGSFRVNHLNLWDDIYCKLFKTSVSGANISVALRQIYSRYLLPYEKTFSSNFGNDLLDDDEEESSFSFNSSHNHNHSIPFNSQTPNLLIPSNSVFQQNCSNNTNDNIKPINKLFCSLLSGFPNELDFALKVSTILINSNRFDWSSDSRFIDLLLETSKKYCCICEDNNEFCLDNVESDKYLCELENSEAMDTNCDCYQRFWRQICSNEQTLELVFGVKSCKLEDIPPHLFSKIEQRIKLIADIIRNLSFTYDYEECVANETPVLTGISTKMLKFILLTLMCNDPSFNNISLDILSNIAPATALVHEHMECNLIQQCINRHCIEIAMTSNNIHSTSRCLEIIARLLNSNNEDVNSSLESYLIDYEVFNRISQLMTCQYEITLLLAILEFCLAISEQKPYMLLNGENKCLIKILLTLLNCESSQYFSASALKRIKIFDDRQRSQTVSTTETNSGQTTGSTLSLNTQNLIPQSNSVDNETFALNWLKATYEPTTNATESQSLKASDLYAEYVKYCCRSSRRNVVAAQSFSQLIKRSFPSSSITSNQSIEGIVLRTNTSQTKSNQIPTSQVMSPILKAHLSAPPKNSSTSTNTTNINKNTSINSLTNNSSSDTNSTSTSTCNSTSTTTVTTTLPMPTTNTSTLIKSLLANKLRSNATTATTPSKSTVNTKICPNLITSTASNSMTTFITAFTTTPTSTTTMASNSVRNECDVNEQSVSSNSIQLSNAITVTPSITLTPTNTVISASNATISSQSVQPQQQFLLVRTIIASPGQTQSGCTGLTTTGTPVRLILPASMLTQQRVNTPTVNGISANSTTLNNITINTSNNNTVVSNITTSTSSADLFLKTVLSGSNSSNSVPVTPIRSNVKSSPLLNVLLDKGKLPDFTTSTIVNNQVSNNAFGSLTNSTTIMQQQAMQPKMYILTTKSPLAMKSLPNLQNQMTQNSAQCLPQPIVTQILTPIQSHNSVQTSSAFITNTTIANLTVSALSTSPTNTSNNYSKQTIPKNSGSPIVNGDVSTSLNNSNNVNTCNTATIFKASSLNAINSITASDLSSIKDIKKAVDDATKLMKRRTEEESVASNKKIKINSVLTTVSPHNSLNHDSNSNSNSSSEINYIGNQNNNSVIVPNSNPQVLNKAKEVTSTLLTSSNNSTVTSINNSDVNNSNKLINIENTNCNTNNSNNSNCNSVQSIYECQWNDCKRTFVRANDVYLHVHNHHIMPSTFPNVMNCLWGGPEGTGPGCLSKRPKLSLLTHLLDFHCNPNVLQQDSLRKKQLAQFGSSSIVLQQPPAHPGYANNAALLAIRRHATNYVEPPTLPPVTKLTPLTVSIRLTSALILRNLAQYSPFVKRTLECFEQYLCELCMSDGRDESRTIAQCLAVIYDKK